MLHLLNILTIVLLFILVRSADLALCAGLARSYIRCIAYSIVAVLALIVVLITVLGLH